MGVKSLWAKRCYKSGTVVVVVVVVGWGVYPGGGGGGGGVYLDKIEIITSALC